MNEKKDPKESVTTYISLRAGRGGREHSTQIDRNKWEDPNF